MTIEHQELKSYLHQRYPFLLVDRVTDVTPDRLTAIKNITGTDSSLQGHFPDEPIYPGVLLMEAMCQTGGLFVALSGHRTDTSVRGYLAKANNFKFKRFVKPGDQVVIEAFKWVTAGAMTRVCVKAKVGQDDVAEGEVTYFFASEMNTQQRELAISQ